MDTRTFLDVFSIPAVIGSALLGVMIGAFYEWQGRGHPIHLWIVGSAFIFMLGMYGELTDQLLHSWEPPAARQMLWTAMASALWIGKRGRQWIELRLAERRTRRVIDEREV